MKTGCSAPVLGAVLNKLSASGRAGYYYSYRYYRNDHQKGREQLASALSREWMR